MACGLVPISYSIGGVEVIIRDQYNGILLKEVQRVPAKFAEVVIEILKDEVRLLEIAKNSRSSIEKNFDIVKTIDKYKKLYKILQNNR
jgi:glycosyltransferase involved in cell wall biosynthesis